VNRTWHEREFGNGWQQVDGRADGIDPGAGLDRSRPPGDGRDAHVPFVFWTAFAATKRPHAHASCSAVVGGKEDKGVFGDVEFAKRVKDATDAGINFLDVRAVHIALGFPEDVRPGNRGR
tara:strand:- start:7 stop:366 length:360 start_codon:yes stop_codon:yes gene_type:complete